tara:strand:+ start:187 stop:414 length:228 start_codon:yes stop_codon:yes gene_type:complete
MNWSKKDNHLYKSFQFKDFNQALQFINKIGLISEELNHHPKITNLYNSVEIELWTHTNNQITALDYKLASKIDEI